MTLVKKPFKKPTKKVAVSHIQTISYNISEVKEIEFSCISLEQHNIHVSAEKLGLRFDWGVKIDKKNKSIALKLLVEFLYKEDKNITVVKHTSQSVFSISNFNEVILSSKDQEFKIADDFMINFIGISISTVRGILITKLANTEYQKILLPLVSRDILKEIFQKGGKLN